jgi:hypothetical protein
MAIENLWLVGLTLFIMFVSLLLVGSLILFIKAKKNSRTLEKVDIYGYCVAFFFLFIAIGYIIRIEFMFFIASNEAEFLIQMTATERSGSLLPAYNLDGRLDLLRNLWVAHMIFSFIGIGLLMFATEYKILNKKSKFILTVIAIGPLPVILFLPYLIAQNFFYISYIAPIIWLLVYVNLAIKSTGSVRKNSIFLLIGFTIFIVGILLNSATVRRFIFVPTGETYVSDVGAIFSVWIAPIMLTGGFLLTLLALLNKF